MLKKAESHVSREVFKFPYSGNCDHENEQLLSDALGKQTIMARKSIIKNIHLSVLCL